MILIIGGRSQGKSAFAHENYGGDAFIMDGLQDIIKGWLACLPADHAEKLAEKGRAGADESQSDILSRAFMEDVMSDVPDDAVVICDEVGCGIVPLDRAERLYRDVAGHVCCAVAARADSVIRVFCGTGIKIK